MRQQSISRTTVHKIDAEIRRLVENGCARARNILTERRADLEIVAKGLVEFDTLTGEEIKDLLAGKPPARGSDRSTGPCLAAVSSDSTANSTPAPRWASQSNSNTKFGQPAIWQSEPTDYSEHAMNSVEVLTRSKLLS
jgi:Peptidase family M41